MNRSAVFNVGFVRIRKAAVIVLVAGRVPVGVTDENRTPQFD